MAKGTKANRKRKRDRLKAFTKNLEKTEYKGIEFTFDDQQLQDEYIKERDKFEKLEINFIEPVTYNDAKSLINGKMQQRLKKLLAKYEKLDNNYSAGLLHKGNLYDKVREEYSESTPVDQIEKIMQLFEKVKKATDEWNANHKNNNGQQKYNIVYYRDSNEGSESPV